MRYFRSAPAVYASICAQLDAAYGYPNQATKTDRTLPLAADLPSDSQGRLYLAISAEYCEFILPSQMLPELIASRAVEEIDEATYRAAIPAAPLYSSPTSGVTIGGAVSGPTSSSTVTFGPSPGGVIGK